MTDTVEADLQENTKKEEPVEEAQVEAPAPGHDEDSKSSPGNFREASYVVLFIAAVFVINAMETGSYRTPWPVAIITLLAGIGLFGYSWHLQSRAKT